MIKERMKREVFFVKENFFFSNFLFGKFINVIPV